MRILGSKSGFALLLEFLCDVGWVRPSRKHTKPLTWKSKSESWHKNCGIVRYGSLSMFVVIASENGEIIGGEVVRWYDTYEEASEAAGALARSVAPNTKCFGVYSWVNNIS